MFADGIISFPIQNSDPSSVGRKENFQNLNVRKNFDSNVTFDVTLPYSICFRQFLLAYSTIKRRRDCCFFNFKKDRQSFWFSSGICSHPIRHVARVHAALRRCRNPNIFVEVGIDTTNNVKNNVKILFLNTLMVYVQIVSRMF